ncbi:4-alpha-glucanotransferase [Immundisolibacter sp.]|uniref:4-alpha-glucanotransferase n=1 Tax=Immundisolibacter sp. TaxID=1934948 RepID=UPI002632B117|nr:4-alpha-glucanotransferase [Immundisolibacter sp.]MDD3649900.1 4-alpha-glucanotransferase [Immundisolibacter sp.]
MPGERRAGLLLHPTSLPGAFACGDLGHEAYRFVEFLAAAGCSVWQMLPVGPTGDGGSPYQSTSSHAGNPELISLDWLRDRGWLQTVNADRPREEQLRAAGAAFAQQPAADFGDFCTRQAHWLEDFALYSALKAAHGGSPWTAWPAAERDRDPAVLAAARRRHAPVVAQVYFEQYAFCSQWRELRAYAHEHGVRLFGDLPLFVAHDSADVWATPQAFLLDEDGEPQYVAGVPPDYFAVDGQRWGNPHYRWDWHQAQDFAWWRARVATQAQRFDLLRIDHFRGLEAVWMIPADAPTAVTGAWQAVPGAALLDAITQAFPDLRLVAENLGIITPEVEALRRRFGLPGMVVLQFAFDGDASNPHLPHNHARDDVAYTGTHDNDTTCGWFDSAPPATAQRTLDYLGLPGEAMPWPLIRAALASVAELAVLPVQDLLGLGSAARMNTPGTVQGNWCWRLAAGQLTAPLAARLGELLKLYGRS